MEPPTLPEGVALAHLLRLYEADKKKKEAKKARDQTEEGKKYNLEKSRKYYKENKEKVLQKRKERYAKETELLKSRNLGYYHTRKALLTQAKTMDPIPPTPPTPPTNNYVTFN